LAGVRFIFSHAFHLGWPEATSDNACVGYGGKINVQLRHSWLYGGGQLYQLLVDEVMAQSLTGNIENMIGWTKVPLGQAGPLLVNNKNYDLSLATTEGALVASVNRGCKATRLSGGIKVLVENVGATRGPVFRVKGIDEGKKLINWVKDNFKLVQKAAEATSQHLKLVDFTSTMAGKNAWLRFRFNTGEAMGMNMVTIATQKIVELIEDKLKIKCLALSGNFCVDKKANWLNFIEGRGKKVWAEAMIKRIIVKDVLKTTPEKIIEVVKSKQWLGSIMSGSMGANGHFANIAAALFLATGQDMAHVVEASLGVTIAELQSGSASRRATCSYLPGEARGCARRSAWPAPDLYFSVYLPDLMVGMVGGGTRLPSQQQVLKMLGNPSAIELAGIIGGSVLAGELSLTAALASGDLAKAHQKLGRPKPTRSDLLGNKSPIRSDLNGARYD